MKYFLTTVFCFIFLFSQNGVSQNYFPWVHTYGGSETDVGCSVKKTFDGGYIIVGCKQTYQSGIQNAWLIKTDEQGNMTWSNTYGSSQFVEFGTGIIETVDSGFAFVGFFMEPGHGWDSALVVKTNKYGNETWRKKWYKMANSLVQTNDRGFLVSNSFNGDFNIVKLKENGDILWTKNLDSSRIVSIKKLAGEEYLFTGQKNNDIWIQKTDSLFSPIWTKSFGNQNTKEYAQSVEMTKDNKFIVAGSREYSLPFAVRMLIIKIDSSGNFLWETEAGNSPSYGRDAVVFNDTTYFLFGNHTVGINQNDIHIYKINTNGSVSEHYLFDQFSSDRAYDAIRSNDTIIAVIGSGGFQWLDVLFFGFQPNAQIISDVFKEEYANSNIYQITQNYPNPFNPSTNIRYQIAEPGFVSLKVYDVLGNEVATLVNEKKSTGNYEVNFDAMELTSGIYFYQLKAGKFVETKKMILLR